MLGVNVIYTLKPGTRELYLGEIVSSGARDAVRAENGCLQYEYYPSPEDPDRLLLLEKWTTREAQRIHMDQPHMAVMARAKDSYVLDMKLEFYDLPDEN